MAIDDISLEPLLNQSSEGDGSSRRLAFVPVNVVGKADHRTAITVSSTATAITPTTGKKTIEIQNTGSKIVYYGGSGVTSANGIKLFPNSIKTFANVKDSFAISLACAEADTAECRLVEYD